jgi:hypothetical protein
MQGGGWALLRGHDEEDERRQADERDVRNGGRAGTRATSLHSGGLGFSFSLNTAASYSHPHVALFLSLYVDDTSLSGGRRVPDGWLRGVSPQAGSMPRMRHVRRCSVTLTPGPIPHRCVSRGRPGGRRFFFFCSFFTCFYGIY